MKQNVGFADRLVRVFVAVFFGIIYYTGLANKTLGVIFLVAGCILLVTAIFGICPMYKLLGINRRLKNDGNAAKYE